MRKFFINVNTEEELKKEYKKLALKYHPDKGGTNEEMAQINNEYDEILKALKGNKESENIDDGFRDIINKIINFNLNIEICGTWIWVSGNTKEYKKELNETGLWWASKKKMWYWHTEEDKKRRRGNMSMEDIRKKYGTKSINNTIRVIA